MPSFAFTARDAAGRPQAGTLPAPTAGALVSELRGRGWLVLDVRESAGAARAGRSVGAALNPSHWLPATSLDIEVSLQQLGTMIRSGLTLLAALRTVSEQARRPTMARVWVRVAERIIEGSSFADAMAAERRRFSPLVVQLVRMGEASGTLDTVLARAAEHLERARINRATLVTALLYPAFVLLAASAVTLFMLISVIPKLQKFIASRGHSLPTITQALLDGTAWLHSYGPVLLIVVMSVLAALWLTYRSGPGRLLLDRAALRVPVVGGLLRLAGTSAISHGLGLLLGSSITLLDALAVSQTLVGNRAMRRRIEDARQAVLEGRSCAEALRAGREFLPMLPQMVAVGEATGHLDRVFNEIASFHEKQLAASIRRFSALVEPVTILLVGSIVGFVYLAFFLALFSVGGSVR